MFPQISQEMPLNCSDQKMQTTFHHAEINILISSVDKHGYC